MFQRRTRKAVFEPLENRQLLAADLVISGVLARNDTGIVDYNYETSDWFEIRNRGTSSIDLNGWYVTDDLTNPDRWQIPAVSVLSPGGRLVVFASNKDFTAPNGEFHTNFTFDGSGDAVGLADLSGQLCRDVTLLCSLT